MTGPEDEKIGMTGAMTEIEIDWTTMIGAEARELEVGVEVLRGSVSGVEFGNESHWIGIGSVTYTAGNGFVL